MPSLITIKAAAKAKGLGIALVRRLVRSGDLPIVEVPGRQFPLVDLTDWDKVIEGWKSGSLPGSTENSAVSKPQDRSAQKERRHEPGMRANRFSNVPYYERFPAKSNA